METATAYLETFGCGLEVLTEYGWEHDHDPRADCRWGYRCSECRTEDLPCILHAPLGFPGLQLAECTADPRHPRTWLYATDAYPPPCMYCAYEAARAAHEGCEHGRHRAWRRWKLAHKLAGCAYSLGFVKCYGIGSGGGCRSCLSGLQWGASSYLLGWPRWKWRALPRCLRSRHWPVGFDSCSGTYRELDFCFRCSPCPGCRTCKPAAAEVGSGA